MTKKSIKAIIFMKLPYLGFLCHSRDRKLCRIVLGNNSAIKFKIIHTTSMIIGNVFKFRDKISTPLSSSVVYKFVCDIMFYMWGKHPAIYVCAWKSKKVSFIEMII